MFAFTAWTGGEDHGEYKQVQLTREIGNGWQQRTAWIPAAFATRHNCITISRLGTSQLWEVQQVYPSVMSGDAIYRMRHQEVRKTGSSHPPIYY